MIMFTDGLIAIHVKSWATRETAQFLKQCTAQQTGVKE